MLTKINNWIYLKLLEALFICLFIIFDCLFYANRSINSQYI